MANVQPVNATTSSVDTIKIPNNTLNNTAQDWFRDMRMSADVNKTTVGVESDVVTPDLLLATSKKLLNILQQKAEPDPKDSLEFQRFYGPAEYFAEHVLRDSNKVGRNLLWKATNKGNLDFMQPGSLDKHISDVFYDSKLSQMVDASSPLELMDVANKTTRLGEGGIEDLTSAPDEMRTVQPSFFGFLDPVRCYAKDTEVMTDKGWVKIQDITKTTKLACLLNGDITYHEPYELHSYKVKSSMYLYGGPNLSFNITPNHRMYYRRPGTKKYCTDAIEDIKVKSFYVRTGTPRKTNDTDYDWSFIADTIVNATIHSETYKTDVLEKYMYSADTSLKKSFLIALRKNLEVAGSIILYDEAFVDFITKIAFDTGYSCHKTKINTNGSDCWELSITEDLETFIDLDAFGSIINYDDYVYCPTVPGGLVFCRYHNGTGFWCHNSPESKRVGLDMYMSKHVKKGSDGKLYATFINAHTGKEELVDSVTASKSVVTTTDMMEADTDSIFALGGPTGVRIVKKSDVDYYLPRSDEAYSVSSNMIAMPSAVKEMRLLMGCLHPETTVLYYNNKNEIEITRANKLTAKNNIVPGCTEEGLVKGFNIRQTISKFPPSVNWFLKIILKSGRSFIVSKDHKCAVVEGTAIKLKLASELSPGDKIPRTYYKDIPNRRTFINGTLVDKSIMTLIGFLVRDSYIKSKVLYVKVNQRKKDLIDLALLRLNIDAVYENEFSTLRIENKNFIEWYKENIGSDNKSRKIPSVVLSSNLKVVCYFIDAYNTDETKVALDSAEDLWILDIPNIEVRDGLSFLLQRMGVDTLYRDHVGEDGTVDLALKIIERNVHKELNDIILDDIKAIQNITKVPIMVDIDVNDNLYALANGVITHNSKYPLQAISLDNRETPLVRPLDERSGKDMNSIVGKYLGARYTEKDGTVAAVRKDRIDMIYSDGSKGSIPLYNNFPMNSKGFITNTPQVKAGQKLKAGDLVASSNYTDDKGVSAIGTNLKSAWISWKGGTFEDAVTISESAAKKLTSTTMYKTDVDLDKTISLGKKNYIAWKPSEFTSKQIESLDDDGVIKPGTVLQYGDPMILAIRANEPSPGTMGKRLLTDMSERWEHEEPGVVTDVVKTRKGVRVFATVTAPARIGDKVAGSYGNKSVIAKILPDEQMPKNSKGEAMDILFSPLGIVSRTNPAQLHEALLGKVAAKTKKVEVMPAFFKGDLYEYVSNKLKQHNIPETEDLINPEDGSPIKGINTGISYVYKLKHLAESKKSARGTDEYDMDEVPAGKGMTGSKRFGTMEQTAMVGHGAFDNILDAKLIRGQANSDFWRSLRTGEIPTVPGEPLVHRKFFAHLTGSGIRVKKTPKGISIFSLSEGDVNELAGPRELKSRDTYEAKTFRPLDGGLFGQDIFGMNGDKWGYIQLDEPLPNPVMEEPLSRLLNMSTKDFIAVACGEKEVDGMKSASDIKERLSTINLDKESAKAKEDFIKASKSNKDKALKRYVAIEQMRRNDINPADYMLTKIPVLPPIYRPITTSNGLTMVADSNYLYAQLLDRRDDLREAKNLPDEYKQTARQNIYTGWKELTGLYDPNSSKLQSKNVKGLLKWALGDSPKWSAFQRKVLGSTVDTVGRGVVIPDSKLKLNQLGIPKEMAFRIMAPFVERSLVNAGYTPMQAMQKVKDQDPLALKVLQDVMKTHPVQMNRAPSLHKYNIMAFDPVLTTGSAIRVNPSIVGPFAMDFDGDTTNIHVPVSDNARKEARERMFPERNLISMRNRKIMYPLEKEYLQGIYIATKAKEAEKGKTIKTFNNLKEAKDAVRRGIIDINDTIQIINN